MQLLSRMNAKLDIGWKMTNVSCPACNGTSLAEPEEEIKEIYCPKCDKIFPLDELQEDENEEQLPKSAGKDEEEDHYYQEVYKSYKAETGPLLSTLKNGQKEQKIQQDGVTNDASLTAALQKTNDVSKKIGEKLLQGWTMLNQTCFDCFAPLMRSKKGEKICFGCNKDYAKIEEQIKQQKNRSSKVQVKKEMPSVLKSEKGQKVQQVQQKVTSLKKEKCLQEDDIVSRIEKKALSFLQEKVESAIKDNDLQILQKVLSLAFKIKNSFK